MKTYKALNVLAYIPSSISCFALFLYPHSVNAILAFFQPLDSSLWLTLLVFALYTCSCLHLKWVAMHTFFSFTFFLTLGIQNRIDHKLGSTYPYLAPILITFPSPM